MEAPFLLETPRSIRVGGRTCVETILSVEAPLSVETCAAGARSRFTKPALRRILWKYPMLWSGRFPWKGSQYWGVTLSDLDDSVFYTVTQEGEFVGVSQPIVFVQVKV